MRLPRARVLCASYLTSLFSPRFSRSKLLLKSSFSIVRLLSVSPTNMDVSSGMSAEEKLRLIKRNLDVSLNSLYAHSIICVHGMLQYHLLTG